MDLGIKELKKGRVYDKPPPDGYANDYERVWHLKRKQYIKLPQADWNLPKHIMDEFNLWEFKK